MKISAKSQIDSKSLKKLKDLTISPVILYEKSGKRSEKKIFDVKSKKNSKNMFTLVIKAEGGLPIKRFVIGDGIVPGISTILDTPCECGKFDFLEVEIQ